MEIETLLTIAGYLWVFGFCIFVCRILYLSGLFVTDALVGERHVHTLRRLASEVIWGGGVFALLFLALVILA
ncbi:MAG: hypothetical protein AAF871_12495 [Pseudomonadota bacterium]